MLVVGLTGGIGSGKSTVAAFFEAFGITVIDADQLSRQVVQRGEPALTNIVEHFGKLILDETGALNRSALRQIVFNNPAEKLWLEELLHPLIRKRMKEEIRQCHGEYCILMSPLLLETAQREEVDRILVIDAPESLQIERTMHRDGNDESLVRAIMATQSDRNWRHSNADDLIINDQDLGHLKAEVARLHSIYLDLARADRKVPR